ncbi:hypothetical protein BAY61_23675 [Prauserella marina]|uniref:Uncharacterized protein n=1 Tax=Prauserella marina TaxID=530584 RepID=A0A222VUT9_9PSEU|nr:hypothetical protein [Prauserella marina]ASR37503.1 hypothetical protein BAY61_23675 [Prauserella marina]PWV75391.1 hypothetical protein DES30_1066 [Prauserella marina]SDD35661.1 hypothetical protein SAMN05421630_107434 [Prauserella marina]
MSGDARDDKERTSGDSSVIDELAADVDSTVDRAVKTVEFGTRGFRIALVAFAVLVSLVLPWVGEHAGWQVLLGEGGAIPRLFATTATVFGVLASALAVSTRRWWLAWVCAIGCSIAFVDGMLGIWSQQSSSSTGTAGGGPGLGMIIAVVCVLVLAVQWMRVAWSRN